MAIRAEADHKFNRRNIFLGIAGVGLILWAGYDAFINYPHKLEISEAYESLKHLEPEELANQWNEMAGKNNWSRAKPKPSKEVKGNIVFNYFLIAVGLAMAIFFFGKFLRIKSSWVEADEKGLKASWGPELKFKDLTKIDKVKWERKGIAKLHYETDGKPKIFVMDDFKFQREPMGKIMDFAQANLSADQIIEKRDDSDDDDSKDDESKNDDA